MSPHFPPKTDHHYQCGCHYGETPCQAMTDPAPKPIADRTWPCELRCSMCGANWTIDVPMGTELLNRFDGLRIGKSGGVVRCPTCDTARSVCKLTGLWK